MGIWYYYDIKGEKQGPFNNQQLKFLVRQRKVKPETILETGDGYRGEARDLPIIFPGQKNDKGNIAEGVADFTNDPMSVSQPGLDQSLRAEPQGAPALGTEKCPNCGGIVPSSQPDCFFCGASLHPEIKKKAAKQKRRKFLIWGGASLFLFLIIGSVVSALIYQASQKKKEAESDTFLYEYTISDQGVIIDGFKLSRSNLSIPSVLMEQPVIAISYSAFANNPIITEVTIPDSVTMIEPKAFANCSNLVSITFPNQLSILPYQICSGCTNLKNVHLPDNLVEIEDEAFKGCGNLTPIQFPMGLETIGKESFCECRQLSEITIPESVKYIGPKAFKNCSGLKKIGFNPCNEDLLLDEDFLLGCDEALIDTPSRLFVHLIDWYKSSVTAGDSWGYFHIGLSYLNGSNGCEKNPSEAIANFKKADELGNSFASVFMGRCYLLGIGTYQDFDKAMEYLRNGVSSGNTEAKKTFVTVLFLVDCNEQTFSLLSQNDEFKNTLRSLAERSHHPTCQFLYGLLIRSENKTGYDKKKAFTCFYQAAIHDINGAQVCLGECYENGDGTFVDYQKAAFWYEQAASKHNIRAQYLLGMLFLKEDKKTDAIRWLQSAAAGGSKEAQRELDQLESTLEEKNEEVPSK